MKKLSVIIPVFNEEKTLEEIVRRVQEAPFPLEKELLIVNDASTDGTREILERLEGGNVRVFHHTVNQGKGAGIRTAQPHCTGELVVVQDADVVRRQVAMDQAVVVHELEPLGQIDEVAQPQRRRQAAR